ncbi:MAG: hypothetical protein NPINA01_09000 [Nitrospinaceae bacterium]|nr:MAG: hypothetical protein NPINA01_09000 [Nitrospinaceae bacterium]
MSFHQIKTYCEEARKIAEQEGVTQGLAFLIGEKFSRNLHELNKCRNKLRFLYPEKNPFKEVPSSLGEKSLRLNYALTIKSNYGELLDRISRLEEAQKIFIREIKTVFELSEIQGYLDSHPRLGFKQKSVINEETGREGEPEFSTEDIFSEVEDIYLAETMKKLFP